MDAPRTARERARRELTAEITASARRQLAEVGPSALSLRAVARELGMVSSAVYRYFPSRDALLTALIVEGYDALGEHVEQAEAEVRRGDVGGRWRTAGRAVRAWAVEHPHEWALLYGSPVPGYAAPADTVDPAIRVVRVLLAIVVDGHAAAGDGGGGAAVAGPPLVPGLRAQLEVGDVAALAPTLPPPLLARAVLAWSALVGAVSFELFGHLRGSVADVELFHEQLLADTATSLGLRA